MSDFLNIKAVEQSTFFITAAFTNSAGNSVVPNNLTWTLTDKDGNIINSREGEVIATPAASVTIMLSGDDLELPDIDDPVRVLLIEGDYDDAPTSETGVPIKEQAVFEIENLIAVT